MSTTPQFQTLGNFTYATNPSTDSEFSRPLIKADFNPTGGSQVTITQINGRKSGERTQTGVLYSDADFRAIETIYNAMRPVQFTDWFGNTYNVLIIDFKPRQRLNDIAHNFQTIDYTITLRLTT